MNMYKTMTDEALRKAYVPNVYQRSIHAIDYKLLKANGIKCISFDIDDTISSQESFMPSKDVVTLFESLKNMGFKVILCTNAGDTRGSRFAKSLGTECVTKARKPLTLGYQQIQEKYGLLKSEMAHVGNSLLDDVAGGNAFGITTCLVRRRGKLTKVFHTTAVILNESDTHDLTKELKSRGIWRKHHKHHENDQYYQLGETPEYMR